MEAVAFLLAGVTFMSLTSCPLCRRPYTKSKRECYASADGSKGFCKKLRKEWKRETVKVADLKSGPIRHRSLSGLEQGLARWSFKIVGHYLHPTLEQWETGFMRDLHKFDEILFWHRLSLAFIGYHRQRNIPLRSPKEEKELIGSLLRFATEGHPAPKDAESKKVAELALHPPGWEEERARMLDIVDTTGEAEYSPPLGLENWPE
jgi:hypothetical protein